MIYGYCRCSKQKQNISRQSSNIKKEFPDSTLIKEYFTGTTTDRPQWNKLKKIVKEGDTIVFDSVSRMSRNSSEGFSDYKELYIRGINLIFLKEPHINTDVFKQSCSKMLSVKIDSGNKAIDDYFSGNISLVNKLLLDLAEQQIIIAFDQSQKEVDDLHARISEGLREAVASGKHIGLVKGRKLTTKKSIDVKEKIKHYHSDFEGNLSKDEEVMKLVGCSRNSYFKYKKELKEEINNGK